MAKKENHPPRYEGTVIEALPAATFKVRLADGREVLAHLAGRLKLYHIRVLPGDRVTVELSPYDEKRGRIVYRGEVNQPSSTNDTEYS